MYNHQPTNETTATLLNEILKQQSEQNQLLKILITRQHDMERHLSQWKHDNPALTKRCAYAAKRANNLMTSLLENLVNDIENLPDVSDLNESFTLFELIDRYGYRIQQFQLITHILSQLGST